MNDTQQLKEIKCILDLALAPTIRIEKDTEYPMSEAERVQWVVNELKKLAGNNPNCITVRQ